MPPRIAELLPLVEHLLANKAKGEEEDKASNEEPTFYYTYDAEHRLSQISLGKGKDKKKTTRLVTAEFFYDADGGRTKKVTPIGTTRYVGTLFETRPDGTEVVHVQAGGLAICDIISGGGSSSAETYYLHQDHLGSIWLVSDSTGARVERHEYDPFGSIVLDSGVAPVFQGFTGQVSDNEVEAGLYFDRARYYDAGLRRFLTADSVVPAAYDPQSLNRYAYSRNNPLIYKDPTGNSFLSDLTDIVDDGLKVVNPIFWITSTPMGWSFTASHPYEVATAVLVAATWGGAATAGDSILAGVAKSAVAGELLGAAKGGRDEGMFSGALRGGIESAVTGGVISGVEIAQVNPLEEIALKGFVGGVSAEVNGGKFERGFAFSAAAATIELGYQEMAGYRPDPSPGKPLPGGRYDPSDFPGRRAPKGYNVFGSNPFDNPGGACLQGSACSNFFNRIPGMNAIAGLHDYWMNNVPYNPAQIPWYVNYPSALVAAPITWGALLGGEWAVLTPYLY
jgi:RHS repeat-associated protein